MSERACSLCMSGFIFIFLNTLEGVEARSCLTYLMLRVSGDKSHSSPDSQAVTKIEKPPARLEIFPISFPKAARLSSHSDIGAGLLGKDEARLHCELVHVLAKPPWI